MKEVEAVKTNVANLSFLLARTKKTCIDDDALSRTRINSSLLLAAGIF